MYVKAKINMSNCEIYQFSQVLYICFKIILPVKSYVVYLKITLRKYRS